MEIDTRQEHKLEAFLLGARNSIWVLLVSELEIAAYNACLTTLNDGVLIDLIIVSSQLKRLGLTTRFLSNFRAAGGRIFIIDETQVDWYRLKISRRNCFLVDGNSLLQLVSNKTRKLAKLVDEVIPNTRLALNTLRQLAVLVPANNPLASNDLKELSEINWVAASTIYFRASSDLVLAGEMISLSWNVPLADGVTIGRGTKRLPARGSVVVKISRNTEFELTAYRGENSIGKVRSVQVAERPSLTYFLTKITDNGEMSMKDHPELAHHFGIIAGELVTLNWEAHKVESVEISFGDQEQFTSLPANGETNFQRGQRQFSVNDRQIIMLRAKGKLETIEQEIVIKAFDIPSPELPSIEPITAPEIRSTHFEKWLKNED